ncbi:MAG: restriction endonuclease subunit S [Deltaproteobacteria bacterium]|nr:restriction endonuclease subunit S [Deltaproteobacteria bacterium]
MSGYPILQLGDVADVVTGDPAPQDPEAFASDGPLFVRMQDVGRHHRHPALADSTDRLSTEWVAGSRLRLFPKDSILIPKSGASVNLNHRAKLATDAYVVSHLAIVIPDRTRIEPDYLYWWSANYDPRAQAQVTSLPSLKLSTLKTALVPLPPLDEQRRIVGILNRAAKIERLRKQAQERMREFIPALFVSMFGAEESEPTSWPECSVAQLLEDRRRSIRTGPFGSQLKHSEFTDNGVPVLGIDNVVSNRFRWVKRRYITPQKYAPFQRYRVFPGDVIITIMGTTGRVCVTPDDLPECMSTKHLCVLTLDRSRVEPFFVWGALLFDERVRAQTRIQAQGQVMEGWNLSIVKRLRLYVPPLNAQRSFSRLVARIWAMETFLQTQTEKTSALSESLLSRLLDPG